MSEDHLVTISNKIRISLKKRLVMFSAKTGISISHLLNNFIELGLDKAEKDETDRGNE